MIAGIDGSTTYQRVRSPALPPETTRREHPLDRCEHPLSALNWLTRGCAICRLCRAELRLCKFKGCRGRALFTLDAALAARRGHLCIDHAAQADKLEGGPGIKVNPPPSTCSVGMDWEQ
ncbi:MAG: hypothetical protein IT381_21185 [Deltaproteobacteria bacterium]|nr:hypothetical protein [Deltaproteobacteria bacterium]